MITHKKFWRFTYRVMYFKGGQTLRELFWDLYKPSVRQLWYRVDMEVS